MAIALMAIALAMAWPMNLPAAPFVPARDGHCVAFAPDGQTIAVGISGQSNSEFPPRPHPSPRKCGVIQIYELASKKRLLRIETFGDLTQIAFSPDGSLLAAARLFITDDGIELNEVRVWEVKPGRTRYLFDRCHGFAFAPPRSDAVPPRAVPREFSPPQAATPVAAPRTELAVVSHKRCVVYDLQSGERLRQIPPLADALRVAYLPQQDSICGIVRSTAGFQLRRCDATRGTMHGESNPLPDPFYSLVVPARGDHFATGHRGGIVWVWEAVSLQPIGRLATGSAGLASPFISRTGNLIGAVDQGNSDVVLWDWTSGREMARYTFGQGSLRTYLAKPPQRRERPEEDPARFAFSPDESAFLGGPYGGILRAVSDGRELGRYGE